MSRSIILFLAVCFTFAVTVRAGEPLPIENFAQLAQIWGVTVSRDGKHLAYFKRFEDDDILVVSSLDDKELAEIAGVRSGEDITYNWVAWVNNDRLLVSLTARRNIRGTGKKFPFRRLIAMDKDGTNSRLLLEGERMRWYRFTFDDVIDLLPDEPDHILLGFSNKGEYTSNVYKVDINTGEKTLVLEPEKGHSILDWYSDWHGDIRYGYGWDKKDRRIMLIRRKNGDWYPINKNELFEDGRFRLLGFSYDVDHVFVLSSHISGRDALFKFNLETGELAGKVLENPEVDIDNVIVSPVRKKAVAVTYTLDKPMLHFLDDDYKRFRDSLNAALPDKVNQITSITNDEKFAIVHSSSTQDPGSYYFFNGTAEPWLMTKFASRYPKIDPRAMAKMTRVTYEARDSLRIPAYLTIPNGDAGSLRPAVVMPHGGPWIRDRLIFDFWAQFLASRGYIVLQPNFRGSSGYGDRFEALGYGSWGRAMQDDLTDGAKWLIAQGLVDPKRICIVGGSYGGYAALMGVIKSPEVFKCAVAFAPVTDVKMFLRDHNSYSKRDWDYRRVAGKLTKKEITRISPIKRIEDIGAPVLLVHGDDDARVPVGHSRKMFEKMTKAGKDVRYIELEDESHHLEKEPNRVVWYRELEAFLAKHIGPLTPPPTVAADELSD